MAHITPEELKKMLSEDSDQDMHDFRGAIIKGTGEAKTDEAARVVSQYDMAGCQGELERVQKHLSAGADPNASIFKEPVLSKALRYNHPEVAEMLLKAG